jgi:hypothetical protein
MILMGTHAIAHSDSPHLDESRDGMFIASCVVGCIIAGAGTSSKVAQLLRHLTTTSNQHARGSLMHT